MVLFTQHYVCLARSADVHVRNGDVHAAGLASIHELKTWYDMLLTRSVEV